MAKTNKVSAAKIAQDRQILNTLYTQFEAAASPEEEDRLAVELVKFAFNPDYEMKVLFDNKGTDRA